MKDRYLEVTFRKGKPIAAYLYLPRTAGVKVRSTTSVRPGVLVDYSFDGAPVGIEITAPRTVSAGDIDEVLISLGLPVAGTDELAPLRAA